MKSFTERAIRNQLLQKFRNAKYQARHRGQDWDITEDEFIDLWMKNDNIEQSGNTLHSLSLCRKNLDDGWTLDNVHVITRQQMLSGPQRGAVISQGYADSRNSKS